MNRHEQFSYLEERLCHLCTHIKYCGYSNFTDLNKISEGFINNLINIVYGYECKDLNKQKLNFPGVDLGNETLGIGIQVTSSCKSAKIIEAYEEIYDSRNAINGKLIADIFWKRIIFFRISVEKKVKLRNKTLEDIKVVSHNRFKEIDIINMCDIIADIEKLFDDDYERFMKAYICISKNVDTLPALVTDKCVLEDLLHYFNRPAFTTDFKYECSLEDFEKAITETISNINIGRANTNNRQHFLSVVDLNSRELKKQFIEIMDGLNIVRKLYLTMLAKKYTCKVKIDEENVIYTDCEVIFCRAMNDSRSVILHEIKKIAEKENIIFDVEPTYYEDSYYHSPIIKRDTNNFILTLTKIYDTYIIEENYGSYLERVSS